METNHKLKVNKYAWLAYIYFFFNRVGLPFGILYMNLLTPFFYFRILLKKKKEILHPFLLFLIPFDIIHFMNGVEWKSFILSNLLFISTYIFVYAFYVFINSYEHPGKLFKRILIVNFIFTMIALLVFFTPYRELMWYINKFTSGINQFPRLAMFTYEASYYSLMFIPVAFYYLFKVFLRQNEMNAFLILLLVFLPLLLSFSVGVLAASVFTAIILYFIYWRKIFYKKNFIYALLFSGLVLTISFLGLFIFFPNNPFFIRLNNILAGIDSSAKGRTVDSLTMAYRIAAERSIWFGSGLGQIKTLAYDIVKKYYNYWGELGAVRIPNAIGETLAYFGISGLIIRFCFIFYFFFKTKVLRNYYRTSLFLFIFIYQFTGSYITNIVEYAIWALAFSHVFKQFDVENGK